MILTDRQRALCDGHGFDFSDLSALFLNCTLKPGGTPSHTEVLAASAAASSPATRTG